jgi:L-ascorbate metabolism protein UlaG (beta-lactamase superfamily)
MPNRRSVVLGIAAMPIAMSAGKAFAQSGLTGDTIATAEGDVIIHPVGHASLVLQYGDHVIYVDPAKQDFSGLPAPTGILITHEHGDHFDGPSLEKIAGGTATIMTNEAVAGKLPDSLKARALPLKNGGSGELDGIAVTAIPAYNTTEARKQYHPQGRDNGYVLTLGDKKIYIAGDTEDTPEMRALTGIEVAFLPMNLPYTMSVEQAADAVKAFKPAIVYPYHYQGSDVETFKQLVGDAAEVRLAEWYPK